MLLMCWADETYHSLFTTFLAIGAFNVEDKQIASLVAVEPNTLCGLLASFRLVHDFEGSVEEQV